MNFDSVARRSVPFAPAVFLLLWSGGYTVAKVGIADADPFTLLSLRYAGVLLLLAPFALALRPPLPTGRHQWAHLAFVGFLIQAVYFGAAWTAFRMGSSAGAVALVTSLQPILVGLAMPLVSAERVSGARWAGLALGLVGTVLVLSANSGVQVTGGAGLVFATGALLAFTLATVWEKRFGTAQHPHPRAADVGTHRLARDRRADGAAGLGRHGRGGGGSVVGDASVAPERRSRFVRTSGSAALRACGVLTRWIDRHGGPAHAS